MLITFCFLIASLLSRYFSSAKFTQSNSAIANQLLTTYQAAAEIDDEFKIASSIFYVGDGSNDTVAQISYLPGVCLALDSLTLYATLDARYATSTYKAVNFTCTSGKFKINPIAASYF